MEGSPRLRTGKFTHLNSNFDLFFLKKKTLNIIFFKPQSQMGLWSQKTYQQLGHQAPQETTQYQSVGEYPQRLSSDTRNQVKVHDLFDF
jgi:hypothetical protein